MFDLVFFIATLVRIPSFIIVLLYRIGYKTAKLSGDPNHPQAREKNSLVF